MAHAQLAAPAHRGGVVAGPAAGKMFFRTLDGMRGVAALLIVMRHTEAFFVPVTFQESYLAVDVFFVLSGVVLAQAYEARLLSGLTVRDFGWLRAVRIWPLYLLGTSISVLTMWSSPAGAPSHQHQLVYLALGLLLLPNPGIGTVNVFPFDNPAWSLSLEFFGNLVYARCARLCTDRVLLCVMAASALALAAVVGNDASHSLNMGFWFRSFPFAAFRFTYSFPAGILIYRAYARRRAGGMARRAGRLESLMSLGLVAGTGLGLVVAPGPAMQPYYDLAAVLFLFPLLVWGAVLVQPGRAASRVFTFLGAISYAIYMLHAPLAGLLERIGVAWQTDALARYAPGTGVAFLAVLVPFAYLADRFYDWPVRRWLLAAQRARGAEGRGHVSGAAPIH